MIAKEIIDKLTEMAKLMHFEMNNHCAKESDWVQNFVRYFPKPQLQEWYTTVPVLSACSFLRIWFKEYMPNNVFYKGGFTDADLLTASTRDFIRDQIQEKVTNLIAASNTIGDYDPFQGVIADTILALNWAMELIDAVESGHLINWNTLEIKTEIEF